MTNTGYDLKYKDVKMPTQGFFVNQKKFDHLFNWKDLITNEYMRDASKLKEIFIKDKDGKFHSIFKDHKYFK
jgi:hypothetical protein